ncbi:hypothetical protein PM082_008559 [Marasmius tenuissimus]|nr:hypothetical protein PM082_008559 [Marasmius tenuissimus]
MSITWSNGGSGGNSIKFRIEGSMQSHIIKDVTVAEAETGAKLFTVYGIRMAGLFCGIERQDREPERRENRDVDKCPQCRSSCCLVTAQIRKRLHICGFAAIPLGSWSPGRRCRRCGWIGRESRTGPGENSRRRDEKQPYERSGELNQMYRIAEMWHRPPTAVDNHSLKLPALTPGP